MPSKKPEREFRVGGKVRVNLHAGKIADATIRAIIPQTDGLRLQVDFGFEQTALIHGVISEEWWARGNPFLDVGQGA